MLAIGLMSGTSLDGVDACLVKINSKILNKKSFKEVAFSYLPYEKAFKEKVMNIALNKETNIQVICSLNVELSNYYVRAVKKLLDENCLDIKKISFIAVHGQTVWHNPNHLDGFESSTLQLGDPSFMAEALNTIIISNFRMMDMAAGGSGAPLVPFANYVLYTSKTENIALQNIGGIANVTYLKKKGKVKDIIAFDTGPGNMLIDMAMKKLFDKEYDDEGKTASKGIIDDDVLSYLMKDEYLYKPYPKSSGREKYNETFLNEVIEMIYKNGHTATDVIATLTAYTADSICFAYRKFLGPVDKVILSGGGANNKYLVNRLKNNLQCNVIISKSIDSLEALSFAVLGYHTLKHQTSNVPSVTGARKEVVLGTITNPMVKR